MPTFVFSTYGARGDVFPYLAIARELQGRGHRVAIATSESYRAEIEARGLTFRAVRPDLPSGDAARRAMHPLKGTEFLFRQLLLPALRESVEDLRAAVTGADVLVTHVIGLAGPIVAAMEQKRGLKWASSAVSPLSLFPPDSALTPLPRAADFSRLNGALLELVRRQYGMQLKAVQEFRAELGLPRGDHALWSDPHSPWLQLGLWPQEFAPVARGPAVGFCLEAERGALPPQLDAFLQAGAAPLLFVAASLCGDADWARQSVQAAQILGRRAVLLGIEAASGAHAPDATVLSLPFAPLAPLLPRVSAMVHFGGIGTLALGLGAATPMLLCPRAHDQPDNARRARRLGLARVLEPKNYRAAHIARAIHSLENDAALRTRLRDWSFQIQSENGARQAADALEKLHFSSGE